jgi:putative transposase
VLARRKADADELARRQRRASRKARLRLAPISEPDGEVEEITAITRADAAAEATRRHDERLRRLARTDLLDLDADPRPAAQPPRRSE